MNKNIFLTLALMFFALSTIFGQNGVIRGRVFDEANNDGIPFANVIIMGTTTGSTSDLDGNFIITGVQPGFVQLQVSYVGSKPLLVAT
jgi:hypothetical protein